MFLGVLVAFWPRAFLVAALSFNSLPMFHFLSFLGSVCKAFWCKAFRRILLEDSSPALIFTAFFFRFFALDVAGCLWFERS